MAARPKYNAQYHDDWAWSMAAMGATNEEIAEGMGVSKRTIIRWAKEHESFGKALNEGKGVSDAKVIHSLYQRATGYEYEEEKRIVEYDKDGNIKPVKVEKTKKHIPPDVAAQCFWLKNRQREKWQDRPMNYIQSDADNETEVQIYLPDNGRDSAE
jgi:transposase